MKQGKVWGHTTPLITGKQIEIHRVSIKPNSQCSRHFHADKWNAFQVISGKLFVDVFQKAYKLVDTTELKQGETTWVAPGIDHIFRTGKEPCEAWEVYWPRLGDDMPMLSVNDIVRKSVGKTK